MRTGNLLVVRHLERRLNQITSDETVWTEDDCRAVRSLLQSFITSQRNLEDCEIQKNRLRREPWRRI